MIEQRTVFVLGAGAHCSYGFPSGEKLKAEIVKTIWNSVNGNYERAPDFQKMARLGDVPLADIQADRLKAFADALQHSGQPSIDAFLNANRHQPSFGLIGKAAIAHVLLKYENSPRENLDDWLSYLFAEMIKGVSSRDDFLSKNKVGFVTFNYDRFLETWLHKKIKHSFGINDEDANQALKRIPIHHVYGTLGPFPETRQDPWIEASQSIRTIYETTADITTLDQAKDLLSSAHVICLLGFGFHSENIELLDLTAHVEKCKGVVASSIYGITSMEWQRYSRPFKSKITQAAFQCLDTLRNVPIF